jgi:uncharacterized protein (UPF0335 family)
MNMDIGGFDGGKLRSLVDRYEDLQNEIDVLVDTRGHLMKEVGGSGFDKKTFKLVIKRRRMGASAVAQEDLFVQLYERELYGPAEDPMLVHTRGEAEAAD